MTHPRTSGNVPDDRSLSRAMFVYGFAMFMLVYMVQPLLPRFADAFSLAPAAASQVLSASTLGMAAFLIPASLFVTRFERKRLLVLGLLAAGLLSVGMLAANTFHQLVMLRLVFGIVLSALPASALAYLAGTVDPSRLGQAVGLYIAGNAMGGMSGRLLALALSEWFDWHVALALLGGLAVVVALAMQCVLPPDAAQRSIPPGGDLQSRIRALLADPGLPALFAMAFLLSGTIVSVYNYISFRLAAPPHSFGFTALCGIYALYVFGMLGSAKAGAMADRFGRGAILVWLPVVMLAGLVLTWPDSAVTMVIGMGVMTFGFFAGHSVASGWVSARAPTDRSLASSLYLTSYYLGASVLGTAAGAAWSSAGWKGVIAMNSATLAVALYLSLRLKRIRPLQPSRSPVSNHHP